MSERVTIDSLGSITIPVNLREAIGLKPNDELTIERANGGLLLRPAFDEPIEDYTDRRITEFAREEEALGRLLPNQ